MCANLASGHALAAVAEDVAGDKIDPAHDKDDDASGNYHTPESKTKRLLADSFFVEIAEHVDAKYDHCECQRNEAVSWTEQWPIAGVEATEE